jgi:hypothetical protein
MTSRIGAVVDTALAGTTPGRVTGFKTEAGAEAGAEGEDGYVTEAG